MAAEDGGLEVSLLPMAGYREYARFKTRLIVVWACILGCGKILYSRYPQLFGRGPKTAGNQEAKGKNKGKFKMRAYNRNVKTKPSGKGKSNAKASTPGRLSFIYDEEQYEFVDTYSGNYRTVAGKELRRIFDETSDSLKDGVFYMKNSDIQMYYNEGDGQVYSGWGFASQDSKVGNDTIKVNSYPTAQVVSVITGEHIGWAIAVRQNIVLMKHFGTDIKLRLNDVDYDLDFKNSTDLLSHHELYVIPKGTLPLKSIRGLDVITDTDLIGVVLNTNEISPCMLAMEKHSGFTQPGWCGSPVVSTTDSKKLVGIHWLGDNGEGVNEYLPFTSEIIEELSGNLKAALA